MERTVVDFQNRLLSFVSPPVEADCPHPVLRVVITYPMILCCGHCGRYYQVEYKRPETEHVKPT